MMNYDKSKVYEPGARSPRVERSGGNLDSRYLSFQAAPPSTQARPLAPRVRTPGALGLTAALVALAIGCGGSKEPIPAAEEAAQTLARKFQAILGGSIGGGELLPASLTDRESQIRERAAESPRGPQPVTVYLRRGETLGDVAKWTGLTETKLAEDNAIEAGKVHPAGTPIHLVLTGEELDRFEAARAAHHGVYRDQLFSKFAVSRVRQHVVKKGDNAWKLGRLDKHLVPIWLLEEHNPSVSLERLSVGDVLEIPVLVLRSEMSEAGDDEDSLQAAEGSGAARVGGAGTPEDLVIRVQPGESLSHYAKWSGLSAQAIAGHNQISDPRKLSVGQEIRIPLAESHVTAFYRRRQGNKGRQGSNSAPGVAAPAHNASAPAPQQAPKPASARNAPSRPTTPYTVRSGDSAWALAVRKYGISLAELQALNPGTDLTALSSGDVIRVPAPR